MVARSRQSVGTAALRKLLPALLLAVMVLGVFRQTGGHPFITLDDTDYILGNPPVKEGLTRDGIRWAFTTFHMANWHPLTWLSHMADVELFGLDAGWHHRVSVLFHGLNTVLLFLVLEAMTGALWRSFFVAALFGVHPLHVESVAWVSERKDVLSAFFFFLALLAYRRYARRPGAGRYLPVPFLFLMGLLSKPMVVTFPFVLLLLDYWPLGRTPAQDGGSRSGEYPRVSWTLLLLEKVPLVILSSASCVISYIGQLTGEAVTPLGSYPAGVRASNAAVSYLKYIGKTIWPSGLSVYYPHPRVVAPAWVFAAAVAVLVCVTLLVVRQARGRPFLAVGWFWYLGILVPVIGLVQVGGQAMADRYTYLPLVGVFIMVSWGIPEAAGRWRLPVFIPGMLGGTVLLALTIAAWSQVSCWKNSVTLFRHALEATTSNWLAHFNLADALLESGSVDEAISHFDAGLRLKPDDAAARTVLGIALGRQGRAAEAIEQFRILVRYRPRDPAARTNLGVALDQGNRPEDAVSEFREALRLRPDYPDAHSNLGAALYRLGRYDEAAGHFREALRVNPDDPTALQGMKNIFSRRKG